MKKWVFVFLSAFFLNLVWENAHRMLYSHYRGESVSEFILVRAALVDAIIILGIIVFLALFPRYAANSIPVFIAGLVVAIVLERWALATDRWAYAPEMPVIPFLNTGLTPTFQLGIIGYWVHRFIGKTREELHEN
ncbi:MAG: hypothetical protein HY460_01595 [Parcubacteria group bacterium]|nr:hypothetical protein [Parcubacteria group bacterium]